MKSEVWKDISGYEGRYQVSSFGRVKSLKSDKEQILKPLNNGNYLTVVFCKNNIRKGFLVHRLVAKAFIPNLGNLPQVNHKDEDKTNNHVENLEWCTAKYNVNYGTRNKRASKKVDQFTLDGKFVRTWPSLKQVWKDLGIQVCNCCKGKIKRAGNFVWRYNQEQHA